MRIFKESILNKEEKLVELCREGDNLARKELYSTYSGKMLAICYRYTGNMDDAYDVMHDGFIKVFTHFSFDGRSSLETWMSRIMMHQAVDFLRGKKRENTLFLDESLVSDVVDDADELSFSDCRIGNEVLLKFIAELPVSCRTVFNLYVFEEKSHKEIARLLGIKENSSTSQLYHAKKILEKRIKEYISHE